jgi:Ca2+-binding RTX toxin-like protein
MNIRGYMHHWRRWLSGPRRARRVRAFGSRPKVERLEDRTVLDGRTFLPLAGAIPALNSNPGAPASLYLDFDGHFQDAFFGCEDIFGIETCGDTWGWDHNNITTPAFDQDGDPTTFSNGELTAIRQIWERVEEDFAPFNVNVTTVDPGDFSNRKGLRAAIGGTYADWLGEAAGGVSYIGSFSDSAPNIVYAFANAPSGDNYRVKDIADAVSHEAGHAFGLDHQRTFSSAGFVTQEYNDNGGSTLKAPIMGMSYNAARSTWWYGPAWYIGYGLIYQDDMATIAGSDNGFGYRPDDYADDRSWATWLHLAEPRTGIISTTADVDYFAFRLGGRGQITASVSAPDFGNLDGVFELRDGAGNLVDAGSTASIGASITKTLDPGEYRLAVRSRGEFGDVGQYTVSVTPQVFQLDPTTGVLTVDGDPAVLNDAITVDMISTYVHVNVNGIDTVLPSASVAAVVVNAGAGNDTVTVQPLPPGTVVTVNGGAGSDTLVGPDAVNTWHVTANNAGNVNGALAFVSVENLRGGGGDDTFVFANGVGVTGKINGLGGTDTLDYSAYAAGVAVDLVWGSATGVGGGGLVNVFGVEDVTGGSGDDTLRGDNHGNVLIGGPGNDTLTGLPGNDILLGGDGNDTLDGGDGKNLLIGGIGADTLAAGYGDDILISGTTHLDATRWALLAVLAEWTRTDLVGTAEQIYAQRIDHLRNGTGLNGPKARLDATTVSADADADTLTGGAGLDWFWTSSGSGGLPGDVITDRSRTELVN